MNRGVGGKGGTLGVFRSSFPASVGAGEQISEGCAWQVKLIIFTVNLF